MTGADVENILSRLQWLAKRNLIAQVECDKAFAAAGLATGPLRPGATPEEIKRDQTWAGAANADWRKSGHAVKFDTGKLPWHLVPFDSVEAIGKVLQFGAQKYEPRNWEKGMPWSRVFSALMRHMVAWQNGEAKDPETGYSHLWHAGCCILFLIAFELRGIGSDDRPNSPLDGAPES
jgi:hypothetical protein